MADVRTAVISAIRGRGRADSQAAGSQRITWETVEAVDGQGRCSVLGRLVPVTGLMAFVVGNRVPVAWRDGAPVAVIGHRWRRAQFHPSFRRTSQGILEELLVGAFGEAGTPAGIWYRTHGRLEAITDAAGTPLITFPLGSTPIAVKWGLDGRSFAVACSGGVYAVYTLSREDPNILDDASPGVATLLWSGRPLTSTVPLLTATYANKLTKTFVTWLGLTRWAYKYEAHEGFEVWSWQAVWDYLTETWGGSDSGSATASSSATKAFPLQAMLAGSILDGNNEAGKCGAQLVDWYLDNDRGLKFLLLGWWDYFRIRSTDQGRATLTYPHGGAPGGTGSRTEDIVVSPGVGTIGAMRQSDHATVNEQHVFLFNATTGEIDWASAESAPSFGTEQLAFGYGILEHQQFHDPGKPDDAGLPDPNMHQPAGPEVNTEGYYAGANWSNLPQQTHHLDAGPVGDERIQGHSSNGTGQLFSPARLPALSGPYASMESGVSNATWSILGGWTAFWEVAFQTRTGAGQQLWHHRVVSCTPFSRRQAVTGVDEPLLFLVLERFPFVPGTAYINDLPMTWIGIVTATGAIVTVLRDWQYGLSGGSCALLLGNGHRLFWTCGEGAIQTTVRYLYTNLDTGVETTLSPAQSLALLQTQSRLLTPDFLWDRQNVGDFYQRAGLPTLTPDEVLTPYAGLQGNEGLPAGSVRAVNDADVLSPLERYQAT